MTDFTQHQLEQQHQQKWRNFAATLRSSVDAAVGDAPAVATVATAVASSPPFAVASSDSTITTTAVDDNDDGSEGGFALVSHKRARGGRVNKQPPSPPQQQQPSSQQPPSSSSGSGGHAIDTAVEPRAAPTTTTRRARPNDELTTASSTAVATISNNMTPKPVVSTTNGAWKMQQVRAVATEVENNSNNSSDSAFAENISVSQQSPSHGSSTSLHFTCDSEMQEHDLSDSVVALSDEEKWPDLRAVKPAATSTASATNTQQQQSKSTDTASGSSDAAAVVTSSGSRRGSKPARWTKVDIDIMYNHPNERKPPHGSARSSHHTARGSTGGGYEAGSGSLSRFPVDCHSMRLQTTVTIEVAAADSHGSTRHGSALSMAGGGGKRPKMRRRSQKYPASEPDTRADDHQDATSPGGGSSGGGAAHDGPPPSHIKQTGGRAPDARSNNHGSAGGSAGESSGGSNRGPHQRRDTRGGIANDPHFKQYRYGHQQQAAAPTAADGTPIGGGVAAPRLPRNTNNIYNVPNLFQTPSAMPLYFINQQQQQQLHEFGAADQPPLYYPGVLMPPPQPPHAFNMPHNGVDLNYAQFVDEFGHPNIVAYRTPPPPLPLLGEQRVPLLADRSREPHISPLPVAGGGERDYAAELTALLTRIFGDAAGRSIRDLDNHLVETLSLNDRKLVLYHQLMFYFSTTNLAKDVFLRQNMDADGFVPLSLLTSWPGVRRLGLTEPVIMEAVSTCQLFALRNAPMDVLIRPLTMPEEFAPPLITPLVVAAAAAPPLLATLSPVGASRDVVSTDEVRQRLLASKDTPTDSSSEETQRANDISPTESTTKG